MDQAGDGPDAAAGEKPRGIFGRVFGGGGKRYKPAKMGKQLEMYYNEKLGCWVLPGEEEAREKEVAALAAPPPPKSMSTSSMPAATQEDTGSANGGSKPGPPIYGGARGTSRYASASSFSINTAGGGGNGGAGAAPSSVLSGLKPPSTFGLPGGSSMAPAIFKPMAVQQPQEPTEDVGTAAATAGGAVEENETTAPDIAEQDNHLQKQEDAGAATALVDTTQYDTNQYYSNQHQDYQQDHQQQHEFGLNPNEDLTTTHSTQHQQDPTALPITNPSPSSIVSDPVILEVLSFWSYYRSCGYDTEAMTEWVDQNYEPEYTSINYEDMLLDPQIAAAVEQHISENKNTSIDDAGLENKNRSNEMLIEDALIAETAGEYIPTEQQQQQGYVYTQEEAEAGPVASDTTLVAPPPPPLPLPSRHLPGDGWSGFDDGVEVEGGAGAGGGVDIAAGTSDLPAEFGAGGEATNLAIDDYAVPAGDGGNAVDASTSYMPPEYDQYGQYHTTDQYNVEGEQQQQQHQYPTETTVQPPPPPPTAFETDVVCGEGGIPVAPPPPPGEQELERDSGQMSPLGEDQWGYETPAAGPSPARGAHPGGNGNGNLTSLGGGFVGGGGPRFPLPGQQQQHQYYETDNITNNISNIGVGVHPIFSPGQLAADLGVPREAVTMSALFAAEAASVGTLSSRESEDGWSDGGDLVLPPPGSSTATGVVVEGLGKTGKEKNDAEKVNESEAVVEEVSMMVPLAQTVENLSSQIDVVGPWEAAAAAIEASAPTPDAADVTDVLLPPPAPASPVMESKSTQVDDDINLNLIDDAQYKAAMLEIESLKEQLQAATTAADTATVELERSKEEAAVNAATLAEVMGDRDAIMTEKQALEEEIEILRTEAEQVPALVEKCNILETAAAEQASFFTEIEVKLAHLTEERDYLASKLAEAEAADAHATAAAGELAVLQAELDESKEALESRENECEDLKAALELKDDAIIELRAQGTRANEAKIEEISAIESQFESQLATLRGELAAAREAVTAAEESASDSVAAALEDVRERMQIAVAEAIAEKNAELARLENAWKEEQASQYEEQASQLAALESIVMERESEIMELRAQVSTLASESEAAVGAAQAHLAAAVSAAVGEVTATKEAELEAAQARIKELEKKFVLAKKKIAGQQSQQGQLTAEIQNLKTQLQEARAENTASSGHEEELSQMAAALSEAAAAQEALTAEASALQSRLEQLQATKEEEIQALAGDNSQLVQMLGERDSIIESLSSEMESLREQIASLAAEIQTLQAEKVVVETNTANDELVQQLQAELEAAREDISQWAAVAEDADARCTATEEALAAEQDAREHSAAAAMHMQQELALLQQTLASTEAQLNELASMQEHAAHAAGGAAAAGFGFGGENDHHNDDQMNAEVLALRQRVSEMEVELAAANATLRSLDRGGYEDAVEDAEELRSRLAAASQVAAAKEEELLKYKKQLVKAKKLRAADLEKIAALEQQQQHGGDAAAADITNAASTTMSAEIASLREELASVQEQLNALRAVSAETDEGLNEALSALGTEELKVARLAELLMERGMEESAVEEELTAVEEMVIMDEDGAEEAAVGAGAHEEESLV